MVSAAGSGELLFTPRIGALYGYQLLWAMMTLIEEGLEMAGVLILIYALLSYMANYAQEVRIRVGDRPALALDAAPASPYTNSR